MPAPLALRHVDLRARDERALFARYHDSRDAVARDMLVERFLPLARQLARRYQRHREPFDDLFQVACLGLLKAIDRFDPARGVAFSSYAVPTIAGELKRHYRDRTWSVRVPRNLQDLALKIDRAVGELSLSSQRQPTVSEIAARVGAADEDVLEALEASRARSASSLDAQLGHQHDGDTVGERLGSEEHGFALAEDRATLEHLIRDLGAREREVLRLRFQEDLTQAQIGKRLGVSQMQVSRIIRHALTELCSSASIVNDQPMAPAHAAAVSRTRRQKPNRPRRSSPQQT